MAKRYQMTIRSRKSKEWQTTQWPKDTKGQSEAVNQRKDRQHNGQKIPKDNQCCLSSFDLRLLIVLCYLLAIVLSVLPLIYGFWLSFVIFWPLCCLSFLWFTASAQWPKDTKRQSETVNLRRTDNTMAKRNQRTIRSRKSKEGQTTQWPKDSPLVSFGHCVVCPSFDLRLLIALWYLLAIVLFVLPLIYSFWLSFVIFWPLKEGQTTQWPKDNKGQSEAVNQRKDKQYNGQKIPKGNQKP
jgi:ABC-type sugar transport system permease subunit